MKIALITGVTGQDGSYLSEFLLKRGYCVYGMVRKSSSFNTSRIDHLCEDPMNTRDSSPPWARCLTKNFFLTYGDLMDGSSITRLVYDIEPDEIYNLGAQAHVRVSFDQPDLTMQINAMGNLRLLEAAMALNKKKGVKFYQASSSEMFGNHPEGTVLNEFSNFMPCSPYAVAKCSAFWQTANARKRGMFAVNGILFNHESPRRGETYVTRKITRAATRMSLGLQDELVLGNLESLRDWGYAPDYVSAMHSIMQQEEPEDFVVSTGKSWSVRQFLEAVFDRLGLDVKKVRLDKKYFRPQELHYLKGDSSKIRDKLNWAPTINFDELINKMVESDLRLATKESVESKVS